MREEGTLSATVTLGDQSQRSLTPPLRSRINVAAELPPRPVLDFSIAVGTLTKPTGGFPVEFRITVDAGGGEEVVFQGAVKRARRNLFLPRRVDLSPWAGKRIQMTFEAHPLSKIDAATPDLYPIWGNPVISNARSLEERTLIVLVSVDCFRPDHSGVYGYERMTTPHLDAFSHRATVFENVSAASAWTLPTHMSMFTGLMPSFHGVSRTEKLSASVAYLPELLARGGYRTDAVVSGAYLHQNFGFERGFHTYRTLVRPRAVETIDAALDVLDVSPEVSRFLFVHIIDPHWQYLPPADFVDRFGPEPPHIDRLLDKVIEREPPAGPEEIQALINLYDGELAYVDQQIGRLLDELVSRGLFEQSLIIITGDHGEAFYEHGYWQHSDTLYEEMIRIPLIVKWPRQSSPKRVPELVSQIDIFPTVLEAADLPTPPAQGRALAPTGPPPSPESRGIIAETIWHSPDADHLKVAVRKGDLKYIATFAAEDENRFAVAEMLLEELFDLSTDPEEKYNRIESPEAEKFRTRLRDYLVTAGAFRAERKDGSPVVLEEETIERLRKLGYIH